MSRLPSKFWRALITRVCAACCLAGLMLAGCGGPVEEPVYPVHGQVLWENRPLAEALVVLHRLDTQGRNLTARTDASGNFEFTTHQPGDGAPAGRYAATVEYRELVQEGDEKIRTGRNLLPLRYSDPSTSGLPCEVNAGDNAWPAWKLDRR